MDIKMESPTPPRSPTPTQSQFQSDAQSQTDSNSNSNPNTNSSNSSNTQRENKTTIKLAPQYTVPSSPGVAMAGSPQDITIYPQQWVIDGTLHIPPNSGSPGQAFYPHGKSL
jgi:hypothetical protein